MDKEILEFIYNFLREKATELGEKADLLESYLSSEKPAVVEAIDDVTDIDESLALLESQIQELRFMIDESLP